MTSLFTGISVPGLGSTIAIDSSGNASFASLTNSGASTLTTTTATTLTAKHRLVLGTLASPAPTSIALTSGDGIALQMISGTSFQMSNSTAIANVGFVSIPSGLSLIGASGSSSTNLAGLFIGGDPVAVAPYTTSNAWGLYSAGKVKVENATAAGAGTGAFVVTGGAYFGAAAVMNGFTSLVAATISAASNQLVLGNTTISSTTGTARTLTLPDVTDTLAGIAATQTLTNKTLNNVVISGSASTTASTAPLYSSPTSTNISGFSSNVYFNHFAAPATTGSSTATGATVHIAGAPTGTFTAAYALEVAGGTTKLAGGLVLGSQTFSATGTATAAGGPVLLCTASTSITITLFAPVTGQQLFLAHVGSAGTLTIAVGNVTTDQFSGGNTSTTLAAGERLRLVAYVTGGNATWLLY